MPDSRNYELVDGELRELPMSAESSWVAGEIFGVLRDANPDRARGWLFPEGTGFACFQDDPN